MNVSSTSSIYGHHTPKLGSAAGGSAAATVAAVLASGSTGAAASSSAGSVASATSAVLSAGRDDTGASGSVASTTAAVVSTGNASALRAAHEAHEAHEAGEHEDGEDEAGEHEGREHTHLSDDARAASALGALSMADQSGFQSLTSGVASRLRTMAGSVDAGQASLMLGAADQFSQASQTGRLDPVVLGTGRGGFQGHSGVRKYAEQQASSPKAQEVRDLIRQLLVQSAQAA